LAVLDRELARLYKLAVNSPTLDAKEKKNLRAMQRGWIKGRDETWKVKDKKRYVADVYLLRIAEIRQQHPASRAADSDGISTGPVTYDCSGDRSKAYFIQIDPPRAVVYHNNTPFVVTLVRSGSGAKYVGEYADGRVEFWTKGKEALLTTLEGKELRCAEKTN
ncbi:MAG: MliC family protein, partial [Thermodesulfobacteriota bacterium]|nr:MliC family protein [Thermodesulfobacteriota bacterium]